MSYLPPVVATLLADTREFNAKMAEAEHKVTHFGDSSMGAGQKFQQGFKRATTAVLGLGVAVAAYGIDRAIKYQDALDKIQNQANVSARELDYLKGAIMRVSDQTATSTDQVASAYLAAEQAGLHYAAATNIVTAAAKTAWVTGGNVVDVTKSIIAVQDLQIARGMSVAAIGDLMVKANKAHVGSMDDLVKMMGGKVGASMAAYNIDLGTGLAITDTLSKAQYTNTRAIGAMFTAMGKLQDPTKSASKQLASMGVNADTLASKLRQPNGLLTSLEFLRQVAINSGTPIQSLLSKVYGAQGGVVANILLTHMDQINQLRTTFSGASGGGLNNAFGLTQQQLQYKLANLKNQIANVFTGIGLIMLPTVTQLAGWAEKAAGYLGKHPILGKVLGDAAIATFALALASKLYTVLRPVFALLAGVLGSDVTAVIATALAAFGLTTAVLNWIFGRNHAGIGDIIDYLEGKIHPTAQPGPGIKYYDWGKKLGFKGTQLAQFMRMEDRLGGIDFWDKSFGGAHKFANPNYNAAAVKAMYAGFFGSINLVKGKVTVTAKVH